MQRQPNSAEGIRRRLKASDKVVAFATHTALEYTERPCRWPLGLAPEKFIMRLIDDNCECNFFGRQPTEARPAGPSLFTNQSHQLACSGNLLPPSPPTEKPTASKDQTGQASTDDGAWRHKAPDLTTAEVHSVDVKIGPLGFDSRNQRRLGIREPALRCD